MLTGTCYYHDSKNRRCPFAPTPRDACNIALTTALSSIH